MRPKGTILIIGGAEDKGDEEKDIKKQNSEFKNFEILKELLPLKNGKKRIEIITSASSLPNEMKKKHIRKHMKKSDFSM